MNKFDFFMAAMAAGEYRRRAWVISAFSVIKEGPEDWKTNPYPYRIVQTPTGHFYVDPLNTAQLVHIKDAKAGEQPFSIKDPVTLKSGDVQGLNDDITTTYGNVLFNFAAVIYPFGGKIPFQTGRVTPGHMESLIVDRLVDNPPKDAPVSDLQPKTMLLAQPIYVYEYLKFADAMFYLAGFTQLCVPGGTRKTMTAPDGIVELKAKLLEENRGRLHDPAVIAKIQAILVQHDKDWMKGDPGENFLISGKAFNVVRSKLFGMHGAETGLSEGIEVVLIENSLSQGWDPHKIPPMMDSLRAGSFNRGAQTMLGGESVKWLLRASSNISVTEPDCGSKLGNEFTVTGDNYHKLEGFTVVVDGRSAKVSKEDSKSYLGKRLLLRSPMFCKLKKTDYCAACVGDRLAENPTGLAAAVSEYGSAFLSIYMAAAHGKALVLAKMDFKTAFI